MGDKLPKTKREIELYCDKIVAERKLFLLQLELMAISQVLNENKLLPINQEAQVKTRFDN